jgi:prohibitin 2
MGMSKELKIGISIGVCLIGIMLIYALTPFYILEPGYTAIHLRLGKIISSNKESGLYFKIPFVDSIVTVNNRIVKSVIETEALSHDLQFVSVGVAINYKINDAVDLYKSTGTDFVRIVIDPCAQESLKAIISKYTAEGLIQSRHEAKNKVFDDLMGMLEPFNITLVDFNFVHLDFHKDFLNAVENKQIAMQSAMTAKNLTEKIKEEAIQTRERADAESYAMKVKGSSASKDMILLKAIEKWDGRLPVTIANGAVPFMDIAH